MSSVFSVEMVSWATHREDLLAVRSAVFVVEQGVAEEREIDEHDAGSFHFLARATGGEPVGTARLLPSGRVGRVAVLRPWRRSGVGRGLMERVIGAARERGDSSLLLHAQVHSIPFYESLGFVAIGDEFEEEGIPHREMSLSFS